MIMLFAPAIVSTVIVTGLAAVFWFLNEPTFSRRTRILIPGRREPWRLPWAMSFVEILVLASTVTFVAVGAFSVAVWLGMVIFDDNSFAPGRVVLPTIVALELKRRIPLTLRAFAARKQQKTLHGDDRDGGESADRYTQ